MNSEFQIIRWGIPGWIFFMTALLFKMTIWDFNVVEVVNTFSNPTVVAGIAAFFVALGVPLGYILYQVYYAVKWTTIKKKTILLATEGIPDLEERVFKKSGLDLWNSIEMYYDDLMTITSQGKIISYKDLVRRHEIFSSRTSRIHGLGASVLAMTAGFILFFVTTDNRASLLDNNLFLLSFVTFIISLIAVFINYRKQNRYSFIQLNNNMKTIINALPKEETGNANKKTEEDE